MGKWHFSGTTGTFHNEQGLLMSFRDDFYIGVDIGTTGCRVSIYNGEGKLASSSSAEYPLYIPQAGWAEQDPEGIYSAFIANLTNALRDFGHPVEKIKSLAFSSVLHSILPVASDGTPLHPLLIWADSRSQSQVAELEKLLPAKDLYERTGCPLHPMYPLAKLLWLKQERPEIYQKAYKFISIKEFLIYRLTETFVVDRSLASGTGLYNFKDGSWDKECLKLLELSTDKLSPIYPTTHILNEWHSAKLGLPSNLPLVLGAGDGVLSTLGAGAINPGQYTAMIGTSGAIRLTTRKPLTNWETKNWCYNLTEDLWVIGGAISNGGLALRWARDKFAHTEQYVAEKLNLDPYDVLGRYAQAKPAGSDGLIFLPFFAGERSPYWNANARGVLFGLNLNHGKRHFMRATFEGILYSMYSVFKSLQKFSATVKTGEVEIRASGSFTRSPFWVQMMADIFGYPITMPGDPQGSVFGAALMGMMAVGALKSIDEARNIIGKPRAIYQPNEKNHRIYQQLYAIYERVYRNLIKEFDAISEFQNALQ